MQKINVPVYVHNMLLNSDLEKNFSSDSPFLFFELLSFHFVTVRT